MSGHCSFFYVRIKDTPSRVIFIFNGGFLRVLMLSSCFLSSPKTAFLADSKAGPA